MRSAFIALLVLMLATAAFAKMGRYPKSGLVLTAGPSPAQAPAAVPDSECTFPATMPCTFGG